MGLLGSLVWRGISESLLVLNDIKRFQGRKNVIAVMADDRNHPEFRKALKTYEGFKRADWVFVTEDHPRGALHDRLGCGDLEFCFAVVNKKGQVVQKASRALEMSEIVGLTL